MLNAIMSELYKIRKNKIFYICTILVVISAVWIVYKDLVLTTPPDDPANWLQSAMVVGTVFLSIASGFVVTFLMQREYEDKTIINVLTAPTPRVTFIISKLTIWFMWYIVTLSLCTIIYIVGGKLIYHGNFGGNEILMLFEMIVRTRLLSFVASTPLLLVAVMQRRTFYPAIMFSLVFTGVELFALVLPVKLSCLIPWSAVMLSGYGLSGTYLVKALVSIILTGVIGVIGTCVLFRKQNQ